MQSLRFWESARHRGGKVSLYLSSYETYDVPMPRSSPNLNGLRPRERAEVVVKHQVEHEMPTGLRQIILATNGMVYRELQIRQFGKFLAYEMIKDSVPEKTYRIDLAHRGKDKYEIISSTVPDQEPDSDSFLTPETAFRKLWEDHAIHDEAWVRFRKEFGDKSVEESIDRAVEIQDVREAGEIE